MNNFWRTDTNETVKNKANEFYVLTKGYCYNPWGETLKVYPGDVLRRDKFGKGRNVTPEITRFRALDEEGNVIKIFQCANGEGEVFNKLIWLKESDMARAVEIFIEYEIGCIGKLNEKIKGHEDTIEKFKSLLA